MFARPELMEFQSNSPVPTVHFGQQLQGAGERLHIIITGPGDVKTVDKVQEKFTFELTQALMVSSNEGEKYSLPFNNFSTLEPLNIIHILSIIYTFYMIPEFLEPGRTNKKFLVFRFFPLGEERSISCFIL